MYPELFLGEAFVITDGCKCISARGACRCVPADVWFQWLDAFTHITNTHITNTHITNTFVAQSHTLCALSGMF